MSGKAAETSSAERTGRSRRERRCACALVVGAAAVAVAAVLGPDASSATPGGDLSRLQVTPGNSGVVGEPFQFTVSVSNTGSLPIPSLRLISAFSADVGFGSSRGPGRCSGSGRSLTCELGSINPGRSIDVTVAVIPRGVGPLNAQFSVSSGGSVLDTSSTSVNIQPRPVIGSTIFVAPVTGPAYIRRPRRTTYQRLPGGRTVPVGTVVNALGGRVRLLSVRDRHGRLQRADFFSGAFRVVQRRGAAPFTDLEAIGGDFAACPLGIARLDPLRRLTRGSRVRRLWGNGKGRFRTRGRNAVATVRGTVWLTEDRCDGTLIVVRRGVALVHDLVLDRTIVVQAGHSYFAHAPGT